MAEQQNEFAAEYSEKGFWQKLKGFASKAGREVVGRSLQLYYAAQADETPTWAKSVIYGALGYFISVLDAVPDITPIVGYTDDLGVLVAALAAVAASVTPEIKAQAHAKTCQWFGAESEIPEHGEQEGVAPTVDQQDK